MGEATDAATGSKSKLNEPLGAGGDRAEYFKLGCDMLISAHSDLEKHVEKLESELKTQRELERQYSQQLGRMAQLCDTVIPWLESVMSGVPDKDWPTDVRNSYNEIMDYVDAVRP